MDGHRNLLMKQATTKIEFRWQQGHVFPFPYAPTCSRNTVFSTFP